MTNRLTATDASFLYLESASGPMHISSVYVLEGELPFATVFEHFSKRIPLVPSYRRRLAQVPLSIAHPTWVDDPDFDLANHVLPHQLPDGASLEDGLDAAIALNEPMLERDRPLWKVYVISGVPDRTLILQMTHHAMIDGVSGVELTTILYDFDARGDNRAIPEDHWHPDPIPAPATRFSEALRDNLAQMRDRPITDAIRDGAANRTMLGRAFSVISQFVTRPAITAPFNAGIVGPKRRLRYMKQSFGEIREIRRALGGTINDVVLAVVSESVARYLDAHNESTRDRYIRIMCPVSVRTENESGALGNRVSAIFPMLPAWPMDILQRLNAVCAEMDRIKKDEEAQALALLTESGNSIWPVAMAPTQLPGTPFDPTRLAAPFPAPIPPNFGWRPPNLGYNLVCTNVPGVQVPQFMAGHKVLDTVGVLVLSGNVGFSVTILSYNQELFFNFICEPRLMPDLETMVDAAHASFDELLAAARQRTEQLRA